MQVRKFVTIGTIVNLLWIESFLHGTRNVGHISHELVTFIVAQFVQVVHVAIVGHEATATIGLLLEQECTRDLQGANLNHQIVKSLVVSAVKALLRITLHSFLFLS